VAHAAQTASESREQSRAAERRWAARMGITCTRFFKLVSEGGHWVEPVEWLGVLQCKALQ
jgi:hypothetical protein